MSLFRAGVLVASLILAAACTSAPPPAATSRLLATLPPTPTGLATAPAATTSPTAAPPTAMPTAAATSTPLIPASAPPASSTPGTGIVGDWTGTYQSTKFDTSHGGFTVTFTQVGNVIAGKIVVDSNCVGRGSINGSLSGDTITFGVVKAAENIAFDGQLNGNSLSGNYNSGPGCGNDTGTWTATRNP